jgi:hypothetical protein
MYSTPLLLRPAARRNRCGKERKQEAATALETAAAAPLDIESMGTTSTGLVLG